MTMILDWQEANRALGEAPRCKSDKLGNWWHNWAHTEHYSFGNGWGI